MNLDSGALGRLLLALGLLLAAGGSFLLLGGRIPLGRLPGDISLGSGNVSFSFPIVTCIVISLVLTLIINVIVRP